MRRPMPRHRETAAPSGAGRGTARDGRPSPPRPAQHSRLPLKYHRTGANRRRLVVVCLSLALVVLMGVIFFICSSTDFLFDSDAALGGVRNVDEKGGLMGEWGAQAKVQGRQTWPQIKGNVFYVPGGDDGDDGATGDGDGGHAIPAGAGLLLDRPVVLVEQGGEDGSLVRKVGSPFDVKKAVAGGHGDIPFNMFGVQSCEPRGDDEAETELRIRTACQFHMCNTNDGGPSHHYYPEDDDMEQAFQPDGQPARAEPMPPPFSAAADGAGGDADLEAMLNVFRLYGRLFNLSLQEQKRFMTPESTTDVHRRNNAAMARYADDFLLPSTTNTTTTTKSSIGNSGGGGGEAKPSSTSSSPLPLPVTTPLRILENYYTASNDIRRFAVPQKPEGARRRDDGAEVGQAQLVGNGVASPLLSTLKSAEDNIFAINEEAERLLDDNYAERSGNRIPRSDFFRDPFHLSRRGYGTEASIFVALVPVFAEVHGVNLHQRREAAAAAEDVGEDAGRRRSRFASPAHKRSYDGQVPVEAAYNTYHRDNTELPTSLFSSLLTADERAELLLDGAEARRTACAATLENLYNSARWPLSIFTGVLEVVVKREYSESDGVDGEELQKEMERELYAGLDAAASETRSNEHSFGFDPMWRRVRVNGTTRAPPAPPGNRPAPGATTIPPLDSARRSTLHVLFTCVPDSLTRTTQEESFGFQFKDNVRRRVVALPRNAHKQRGTDAQPPAKASEYFNYNGGTIFQTLSSQLKREQQQGTGEMASGGNNDNNNHNNNNNNSQRRSGGQRSSGSTSRDLPFSTEYGVRLSLLKLYKGETYVMFLRVQEHVGGPFASLLLQQHTSRFQRGLRDAMHPNGDNEDEKKREEGGGDGVNEAGRRGSHMLTFYETFSTQKVFKQHWDWAVRLQYLALPQKERAVLSTRARELSMLLPDSASPVAPTTVNHNIRDATHRAALLARMEQENRFVSADFPLLYAHAVRLTMQQEAASARAKTSGRTCEATSPYCRLAQHLANAPVTFTSVGRSRGAGGRAAAETALSIPQKRRVLMMRRKLDILFHSLPPKTEGFDKDEVRDEMGRAMESDGAKRDARARDIRASVLLHRDTALELFLPPFAYRAMRAAAGTARGTKAGRGEDRDGEAMPFDHATDRNVATGWNLSRKLHHILLGPSRDDEVGDETGGDWSRGTVHVAQADGLTPREVAELLFPLALTESQSEQLQERYCHGWLSMATTTPGARGAADNNLATEVQQQQQQQGEVEQEVTLIYKKRAEFCFLLPRRDAIVNAMSDSLFASPCATPRAGDGLAGDDGCPFTPAFTTVARQGVSPSSSARGESAAADEVPLLRPVASFSPTLPHHVHDGDDNKDSVTQRLLSLFFPHGRTEGGEDAERENTIPAFQLREVLVPRAVDTLSDMSFFSLVDTLEDDAKRAEELERNTNTGNNGDGGSPPQAHSTKDHGGRRRRGVKDMLADATKLRTHMLEADVAPAFRRGMRRQDDDLRGDMDKEARSSRAAPLPPPHFLTSVVSADFLFTRAEAFFNISRELQSIFSEKELLATAAHMWGDHDDGHDSDRGAAMRNKNTGSTAAAAAAAAAAEAATVEKDRRTRQRRVKDVIAAIGGHNDARKEAEALGIAKTFLRAVLDEEVKQKSEQQHQQHAADDDEKMVNLFGVDLASRFQQQCHHKQSTENDGEAMRSLLFQSLRLSPRNTRSATAAAADFSLSTFRADAPESIYLDPFLFLLTSEENDLLLSALLWTSGWNFFSPTENLLYTLHFAAPLAPPPHRATTAPADAAGAGAGMGFSSPSAVEEQNRDSDTVSEERMVALRKATVRRLRRILELPISPRPPSILTPLLSSISSSPPTPPTPSGNAEGKRKTSLDVDMSPEVYFMGCQRSLREYWQFAELSTRFDPARQN